MIYSHADLFLMKLIILIIYRHYTNIPNASLTPIQKPYTKALLVEYRQFQKEGEYFMAYTSKDYLNRISECICEYLNKHDVTIKDFASL